MDERLYQYYERELQHLRSTARQFAEAYPKVAGRLWLTNDPPCPDPYVERLLEGFAFMAARTQLKLDAEFPRFTQNLIGTVYPHYLAPMPSVTIVQLQHDRSEGGLAQGYPVARGASLRSEPEVGERGQSSTPVEFRTCHDLRLWPLEIVEARYYTRELALLQLKGFTNARAALRLRVRTTAGVPLAKVAIEHLDVYIRGSDGVSRRLYEQVIGRSLGVVARAVAPAERNKNLPPAWQHELGRESIERLGFDSSQALLPYDERSCQAYRLVREYFAFPQRFMFARLKGLDACVARAGAQDTEMDLIVPLSVEDVELEGGVVSADNFLLHCTPAINLFPRRASPIFITDRSSEHRVVVDPKATLDHEVFAVTRVIGYGERPEDEREFRPFYSATDFEDDGSVGAYFATSRQPRVLSESERRGRQRSRLYQGSEVFISLVDANEAPYPEAIKQLSVEVLCTNRDLAIHVNTDEKRRSHLTLVAGGPVEAVRCVTRPTVPRPAWGEGEAAWRGISHLSMNYLSLTDTADHQGAAGLRDLLRLYADASDQVQSNQIKGVRSVRTSPIYRQVRTPGPVTFARGLEVRMSLEASLFEDAGVFLFGAVLEQFFARYVSVNSFTETVVETSDGKEVMRWATRVGHRPML